MEVGGQRHAPAALPPVGRRGTHCTGGCVGPQGQPGRVRKISGQRGFGPPIVQTVELALYRPRYPSPPMEPYEFQNRDVARMLQNTETIAEAKKIV